MAEGFDDMEMRDRNEYDQYNDEELNNVESDTRGEVDTLNRNFEGMEMPFSTKERLNALSGKRVDIFNEKVRRRKRLHESEKEKSRNQLVEMVEKRSRTSEEEQHGYEKYSDGELKGIMDDTNEKIKILNSNFEGVEKSPDAEEEYEALVKVRNDIYSERRRRQLDVMAKIRSGVSEKGRREQELSTEGSHRSHAGVIAGLRGTFNKLAETSFTDDPPSGVSFTNNRGIVISEKLEPSRSVTITRGDVSIEAPGIETGASGSVPSAPGRGYVSVLKRAVTADKKEFLRRIIGAEIKVSNGPYSKDLLHRLNVKPGDGSAEFDSVRIKG